MAEHLPASVKREKNSLFCFACVAFALPIKLSLSQPTSFLTFSLPTLSAIPLYGKRASSCVALHCQLGLHHDRACVILVQVVLAKHHYISPRSYASSSLSSLSKFFRECDTVSKRKEEQKFPLQLFYIGFGFGGGK